MLFRLTSLMLLVFLSGCVLTENTRHSALKLPALELQGSSTKSIAIAVLDQRPYIVSGEKPAKYIGQFELSMGGPYDAFTRSKQAMVNEFADKMPQLLGKQFSQLKTIYLEAGLSKQAAVEQLLATGAEKLVLISLKEWKSHTSIDTSLW